MTTVEVIKGDITKLALDAIVNAANKTLLGGGGVDGAIHRAAGPNLLDECRTLGGAETGEAKITGGYNLPSKYVIHTVGPIWHGGNNSEDELLRSCYLSSLNLAETNKIKSIAFPSISTGVYGFPVEKASIIAVSAVKDFISRRTIIMKIIFCTFSENDFRIYSQSVAKYFPDQV